MRESPMGMSQLGLYQQCQRKWFFKYILGWIESSDQIAEPLIYGQAIHEGKEVFYKTGDAAKAQAKSINYLREQQMPDEMFLTMDKKARDLWAKWPIAYGNEDLEQYNILGVEKAGKLELYNGIFTSVRLDLLINDKQTKYTYIMDTKTTKRTAGQMLSDYFYKAQPRLYSAWLLREEPSLKNYFRGWITDVASQRLLKTRGLVTELERSDPVLFSDEQINDAITSLSLQTDEMAGKIQAVTKGDAGNYHFQCNYNNCRSYSRLCPYHAECASMHYIGENPPAKFTLDPWIAEGKVTKEFL